MRNIMNRRVKFGLAALAVAALTACASLGALGGFAEPIVSFKFNTSGARKFAQATQENVGELDF